MADNNGIVQALVARLDALEAKLAESSAVGWMSDVQRALALLLIGSFAFMIAAFTLRIMWSGDLPTIGALLKELKDALVNMSLIALGFFFGNTMAKMAQDVGQQKVVDKLTSAPPNGPVAPVPSPTTAADTAWWNKLTDAERAAINAAGAANPSDLKLAAILSGPVKMKPDQDEIDHLVSLGLLTPGRATAIQGA